MVIVAAYLRGAIAHAIKRARDLIEIAQAGGQLEFRALQSKCTDELNEAIISLAQALQSLEAAPEKINIIARIYQAKVQQISNVERVGVFALKNASNDDVELNKVLTAICREIRYPLLTPTVSHTSQDYFEISPLFSLLRVPLLEGRYFLHLSDLYHELCHPLLALHGSTNPRLDALSEAFRLIKNERGVALDRAAVRVERRRGSRIWHIAMLYGGVAGSKHGARNFFATRSAHSALVRRSAGRTFTFASIAPASSRTGNYSILRWIAHPRILLMMRACPSSCTCWRRLAVSRKLRRLTGPGKNSLRLPMRRETRILISAIQPKRSRRLPRRPWPLFARAE